MQVENSSGVAVFGLNSATYEVIITIPGYSFTPVSLVVSGVTTHTYAMSVLTPPSGGITAFLKAY